MATAQTVDIPDPNLGAAIGIALGKSWGDPITTADMAALTGLEFATNLTRLDLGAEYVEVEERYINSNSVSAIWVLSGLTNLTWLSLGYDRISDISYH